jgi:biliverdin reductase / flavin reductase
VKGDVTNLDDVKGAVAGMSAVVVALGTRNKLEATTAMSEGMKNICDAMKDAGLAKVSVCLSAFLFYEPEKVPKVFHELNADHQRMLDIVKGSGLEYRAVFPPHIADEPSAELTVAYDKSPGPRTISKWDLGKFLVDSLFQDEHSGKVIGIANVKKDA